MGMLREMGYTPSPKTLEGYIRKAMRDVKDVPTHNNSPAPRPPAIAPKRQTSPKTEQKSLDSALSHVIANVERMARLLALCGSSVDNVKTTLEIIQSVGGPEVAQRYLPIFEGPNPAKVR